MTQRSSVSYLPAIVISTLVIAFCAFYYAAVIPYGTLQHYDEYYTLERTTGFLESGDWLSVQYNALPDFKKPPLQYWLSAILIKSGVDVTLALRVWPLLFALSLLAATGLLAYACMPDKPYAIPGAVILLSSSLLLWQHATMALLDTGSAFFLTLSVAAFLLSVRAPRWWLVTGFAVGLGFLQKSPSALVVTTFLWLFLLVFGKRFSIDIKETISTGFFIGGALIAVFLVALWPTIQVWRFGKFYLIKAFYFEIAQRFSPSAVAVSESLSETLEWVQWLWLDSGMIWALALVAVCAALVLPKLRVRFGLVSIALVVLIILSVITFAGGRTYPRYLLQILPMLSVVLAVEMSCVIRKQTLVPILSLLLTMAVGGPFFDMSFLLRVKPYNAEASRRFSGLLHETETPLYCGWGNRKSMPPGAVVHFADLDRPITILESVEAFERLKLIGAVTPPYLGLCLESAYEDLAGKMDSPTQVERVGDYVIWRSAH